MQYHWGMQERAGSHLNVKSCVAGCLAKASSSLVSRSTQPCAAPALSGGMEQVICFGQTECGKVIHELTEMKLPRPWSSSPSHSCALVLFTWWLWEAHLLWAARMERPHGKQLRMTSSQQPVRSGIPPVTARDDCNPVWCLNYVFSHQSSSFI